MASAIRYALAVLILCSIASPLKAQGKPGTWPLNLKPGMTSEKVLGLLEDQEIKVQSSSTTDIVIGPRAIYGKTCERITILFDATSAIERTDILYRITGNIKRDAPMVEGLVGELTTAFGTPEKNNDYSYTWWAGNEAPASIGVGDDEKQLVVSLFKLANDSAAAAEAEEDKKVRFPYGVDPMSTRADAEKTVRNNGGLITSTENDAIYIGKGIFWNVNSTSGVLLVNDKGLVHACEFTMEFENEDQRFAITDAISIKMNRMYGEGDTTPEGGRVWYKGETAIANLRLPDDNTLVLTIAATTP